MQEYDKMMKRQEELGETSKATLDPIAQPEGEGKPMRADGGDGDDQAEDSMHLRELDDDLFGPVGSRERQTHS